jgi:DNA-binding IclR family transcriptional regulator
MQTVSRSVERAFEVLELFRRERRPMTTGEIRRELQWPHSSTVVLLTHLNSLGYLQQDPQSLAYFPSRELHGLCAWIADAPGEHDPYGRLVREVFDRVGETTSLSRRAGLFSMNVYVRAPDRADAVSVRPGVNGGLMTLSVVGRALLSTLSDEEVAEVIDLTNTWARTSRIGLHHDKDAILRTVRHIRGRGYLYDCNLLLPGVGAVSFPLCGPGFDIPHALTVAGPVQRMEQRGARLVRDAERIVARFRESMSGVAAAAATRAGRSAGARATRDARPVAASSKR